MRTLFRLVLLASTLGSLGLVSTGAAAQTVRVDTTLGSFVIALHPDRAPLTVEHFLTYVNEGHYAGTIFHRVVHGFVAQGGGYTEDLTEKPAPRTAVNESGNGLSNLRGSVGMARTNEPHSATSQFYINLAVMRRIVADVPSGWAIACAARD